jgi:hypothetical protein
VHIAVRFVKKCAALGWPAKLLFKTFWNQWSLIFTSHVQLAHTKTNLSASRGRCCCAAARADSRLSRELKVGEVERERLGTTPDSDIFRSAFTKKRQTRRETKSSLVGRVKNTFDGAICQGGRGLRKGWAHPSIPV